MKKIFLILFFYTIMLNSALSYEGNNAQPKPVKPDEIPILDKADRLILKRREEAQKLIAEGTELIKKGEKKKNQNLIVKGQIKKEIGEKQLKSLKEQAEKKKMEDENDNW